MADIGVVVVDLLDDQALPQRLPGQHPPSRALDGDRGLGELGREGVEGTEVLVDGGGQLALGAATASGSQVLPE